MKKVIVVADKKLSKFARQLVHGISKIEDLESVYFTLEQYKDNEFKMSSKENYIIFLGDNKVSNAFTTVIKPRYDKHGILWGVDRTKAVIYVERLPQDKKQFAKDFNDCLKRINGYKKEENQKDNAFKAGPAAASMAGAGIAASARFITGPFIALNPLLVPGILYFAYKKLKEYFDLTEEQYKLGIMTFLEKGLDEFINGGV